MGPNGRLRMFPSNTKSIGRHYLTILGAAGPDAATLAGRASSRNCLAARPLGRSHANPWRNTGRIISSTDGDQKERSAAELPPGAHLSLEVFGGTPSHPQYLAALGLNIHPGLLHLVVNL